jgi:transforming growth factor-beta-induced protein
MKLKLFKRNSMAFSFAAIFLTSGLSAQTNVFDNVIATSPNHTYLEAALIQQGLNVALQNPAGTFTVFAPDDAAFTAIASALGTNIAGLLALPNLTDILTYHVLGSVVPSTAVTNGAIVQPLSTSNTLKLTLTASGDVYVNQAKVIAADLTASNGTVHVINEVVLPVETVVDVAIDNGFTSLTAAVITAELLPALTDPLASFTVFAPTDAAFNDLATALGTNLAGVLALPILSDVLLYHVIGSQVLSPALVNGPVATLNGQSVTINLTAGVMVNNATVTTPDVLADNGVVHVINRVLLPSLANISELSATDLTVYPNPSTDVIKIANINVENYSILNSNGVLVCSGKVLNNEIPVTHLDAGNYFIQLNNNTEIFQGRFVKM